jgi:restriction system protein
MRRNSMVDDGLFRDSNGRLEFLEAPVLAQNPPKIDLKLLEQFPEFLAFKAKSKTMDEGDHAQPTAAATIETPLEPLETAYEKILGELKNELLDRLKAEAPAVLERVVIAPLVKWENGIRS